MRDKDYISFYIKVNMDDYYAESERLIGNINKEILAQSEYESIKLSTLINTLNFSPKAERCLRHRNIEIVKDLCCKTEEQIDSDRYLSEHKNEIVTKMKSWGLSFNSDNEESYLSVYPYHVKKIVEDKAEAWEHRLFVESAIVYYEWLSEYRKQSTILWEKRGLDEDKIDSTKKLINFLKEKTDRLQYYARRMSRCIENDIIDSFGNDEEEGDARKIIAATEKLMKIYKSIIRSRLAFSYIDSEQEYRKIIEAMCNAYESFCKNMDNFYHKLIIAKKQLDNMISGKVFLENVNIDLEIVFDIDLEELNVALSKLMRASDNNEESGSELLKTRPAHIMNDIRDHNYSYFEIDEKYTIDDVRKLIHASIKEMCANGVDGTQEWRKYVVEHKMEYSADFYEELKKIILSSWVEANRNIIKLASMKLIDFVRAMDYFSDYVHKGGNINEFNYKELIYVSDNKL